MIETHPFGNFVPANAKVLVLGSFPTHNKNWRFNSFYPGRANFFWRMLSEIYHHKFNHISGEEAAKERLELCTEKGIAISDTIYKCRRIVATSSKDSDLEVIEKMNVLKILRAHPSVHTVILTGSSGKVSAHKLFYGHLAEHKILYSIHEGKPPIQGHFILDGRTIETHSLYSTSGINIGRYTEAVEQYKKYLPGVR
jgi:hypoxanthine-DNA glycosylase